MTCATWVVPLSLFLYIVNDKICQITKCTRHKYERCTGDIGIKNLFNMRDKS